MRMVAAKRPPEGIEDIIGVGRAACHQDEGRRRSQGGQSLDPPRAAEEPGHQSGQDDRPGTDQGRDHMDGPEGIAGEQAGNQRDPGNQRRDIHIAKGGMLAHGQHIEFIAEIAVIVADQDMRQERDAGDDQHGGREVGAAIQGGDAGAQR